MFRAVDSGEVPQPGRILAGSFTQPIVLDPFATGRASEVAYADTAPFLGATNAQAAIDALKTGIPGTLFRFGFGASDPTTQKNVVDVSDGAVHTLATIALDPGESTQIDCIITAHRGPDAARWNLSMGYNRSGAAAAVTTGAVTSTDARGTNVGAPPIAWPDPIFTPNGGGTAVAIQVQATDGGIGTEVRFTGLTQVVRSTGVVP